MIILGIETSCDETAIAVLEQKNGRVQILSNIVATSLELQANFGGVFPEQASREQLKSIIPVLDQALSQAFPNFKTDNQINYSQGDDERGAPSSTRNEMRMSDGAVSRQDPLSKKQHLPKTGPINFPPPIDAIAVTQGPGLIGSLLIGVETAKTLSLVWNKPLIPVNHLLAHFYANWVNQSLDISHLSLDKNKKTNDQRLTTKDYIPTFPALGLLVSGGHTDLVLFQDHLKYTYLGGTRDDAAGECFDKSARLLGLPYPGGPAISKRAALGNPRAYLLPKPMQGSKNFDFSFSGLKTAVATLVNQLTSNGTSPLTDTQINDLSASIEATICQVLVKKTIRALQIHKVTNLMVAGGVAANTTLRNLLKFEIGKLVLSEVEGLKINLFIPPPHLCTDNGVSTATAGFFISPINNPLDLEANPNLSLSY